MFCTEEKRKDPAVLPIEIAYYTGLRLGEVCALTWEAILLKAQKEQENGGSVCSRLKKQLLDMENFHFHMLRHTYTSNLLRAGARPKEVQELLGHSDINTTMNVYAHADREELKRIVEKLG